MHYTEKIHLIAQTTYIRHEGSLRLLTCSLFSNFSFFLLGKVVRMCLKLSCVGRISHHGESRTKVKVHRIYTGKHITYNKFQNKIQKQYFMHDS